MLGFIPGVTSYDELADEQVQTFLDGRAREAKDVVTLDMLEKIVQDELSHHPPPQLSLMDHQRQLKNRDRVRSFGHSTPLSQELPLV